MRKGRFYKRPFFIFAAVNKTHNEKQQRTLNPGTCPAIREQVGQAATLR
jgi:hypothetical protein